MTSEPSLSDHWQGAEAEMARAAARGDAEGVRAARAQGAGANAISARGMPMLLWPVAHPCVPGFEALLAAGADPNAAYESGGNEGRIGNLLARQEDRRFLDAALAAGMDANARSASGEAVLWAAIVAGRWTAVQALIEAGADPDMPQHEDGWYTPLTFYSRGAFDKVVWLLENGADAGRVRRKTTEDGRVEARPYILQNIFYYEVDESYPALAAAQARAQEIVREQGHERPPRPARYDARR